MMPKFTTISPTHVPGKKEYAWQRFLEGKYVAIGWLGDTDLTGKSFEKVIELIRHEGYDNESSAIESFQKFLSLEPGDYVAVNNTNHGLFGLGKIISEYRFQERKHDIGSENPDEFYSHYRDVEWIITTYTSRTSIITDEETGWQPYGTMGKLYTELPPYVARLLDLSPSLSTEQITYVRPAFLEGVINCIEALKTDPHHQERAHESLAEDFFVALGYRKHKDIKYRQGRVDITLESAGHPIALAEIKRDWSLNRYNGVDAVKQAYFYAHDLGIRYVIVTNGDTYLLFDRLRGLSWENNILGEFRLTNLQQEDLRLVEQLRPQRLSNPDFGETLRHLAECFPQSETDIR